MKTPDEYRAAAYAQMRAEGEDPLKPVYAARATTGDPTEPEPLAMQARELLLRVRELEAQVAALHEWRCPSCGATTRARMADQ